MFQDLLLGHGEGEKSSGASGVPCGGGWIWESTWDGAPGSASPVSQARTKNAENPG